MPFVKPASFVPVVETRSNVLKTSDLFDPALELNTDERPTVSETLEAGWYLGSGFANLGNLVDKAGEYFQPVDTTFNPFERIKGTVYENYSDSFLYAGNDDQVERIKGVIDEDREREEILSRSGFLGVASLMGGSVLSPAMLIPLGGAARTVVTGGSLLKNAASTAARNALLFGGAVTADEFLLLNEHYTRTVKDSATAIGTGTVLGGLLGGAIGAFKGRTPRINAGKAEEIFNKIYEVPGEGQPIPGDTRFFKDWQSAEVGLVREGIVAKIPGFTPGQRTATSPIPTSRRASFSLVEQGIAIEGEIPQAAVETIVNQRRGVTFTKLNRELNEGFRDYLFEANKLNLRNKVNSFFQRGDEFDAFGTELITAMTRGDTSNIPQVERVAKAWRKEFNKIGQELIDEDLIPLRRESIAAAEGKVKNLAKEVKALEKRVSTLKQKKARQKVHIATSYKKKELKLAETDLELAKTKKYKLEDLTLAGTAESWFHRKYNKVKIRKLPEEFEVNVAEWLAGAEKIPYAQAKGIAREVYDQIITNQQSNYFSPLRIKKGVFKGRTLMIPDDVLRPWLVNDPLLVMDQWLKTVLADIELKKRFGSLELEDVKAAIRQEAKVIEELEPKQAVRIRKKAESDIKDIDGMLLRLRGLENLKYENDAFFTTIKTIRNWNNTRLMGSLALNAFTDIGQLVLQNGFTRIFSGITKLFINKIANPSQYKAYVKDMEAMGIGVDAITNSRRSLFELGAGESLGNRFENFSRRAADFTFKASLMSNIDGFLKRLASYVSSERIYRNALKGSDNISDAERSWMRNLGIRDQDYADLAQQFKMHSRLTDKFRSFNIEEWTNQAAASRFSAALKKVESVSIITPGAGDSPLIFDNPAFQLLFQYKRFAMAATQRSLIPALQRTDAGTVAGLSVMFTGGVLREIIATTLRGQDPSEIETGVLIERAVKRMDAGGYLVDLYDNAEALIGDKVYGRSAVDEIMGPSAGWINTTSTAIQGMKRVMQGETPNKQQVHAMRLSLPGQNIMGLNVILTKIEQATNQTLGNN